MPLPIFRYVTLPIYACAMICLFLIQFLNFKRSKWLLPTFAAIAAALFAFSAFLMILPFIVKIRMHLRKQTSYLYRDSLDVACLVAAVVATGVLAIAFCCTCVCYHCCWRGYENNCFPMTHKVKYDTSNPDL